MRADPPPTRATRTPSRPPWTAHAVVPVRTLPPALVASWSADALVGAALAAGHLAPDVPATPARRLGSLAPLPPGGVVALVAAAWVHDGGEPPREIEIAFRRPRRSRHDGIRPRCITHPEHEVWAFGSDRVTSPRQTAADLARVVGQAEDIWLRTHGAPERLAWIAPVRAHERALVALLRRHTSAEVAAAAVRAQPGRARQHAALRTLARLAEAMSG